MTAHCRTYWLGQHARRGIECSFCDQQAVYHWREQYPDVLLCVDCLDCYPEAWLIKCFEQPVHLITTLVPGTNYRETLSTWVGTPRP